MSIISQIDHTRKTLIENVTNLISSAKIYEKELENRIGGFNQKINQLPKIEKQYIVLQRKYQLNEETVKYLQSKKYEASLAKAGTESDHKIIDSARLDGNKPVSPNKDLSYFLGIFSPIWDL